MRRSLGFAFVALVAISLLSGCSGGKVSSVHGTVTLDGKPLSDATVLFVPRGNVKSGNSATTDASGKFELLPDQNGIVLGAGTYAIVIDKLVDAKTGKTLDPEELAQREAQVGELEDESGTELDPSDMARRAGLKNLIPPKYGDPRTTPFVVEIKPGSNDLGTLELTSK